MSKINLTKTSQKKTRQHIKGLTKIYTWMFSKLDYRPCFNCQKFASFSLCRQHIIELFTNLSEIKNVIEASWEIAHSLGIVNFVHCKYMCNLVIHSLVREVVIRFDPKAPTSKEVAKKAYGTLFTLIEYPLFLGLVYFLAIGRIAVQFMKLGPTWLLLWLFTQFFKHKA